MELSLSRAAETIAQRHALISFALSLWISRTTGKYFYEGAYTPPECIEGSEVKPREIPLEGVISGLWYRITVFEPVKSLDKPEPA